MERLKKWGLRLFWEGRISRASFCLSIFCRKNRVNPSICMSLLISSVDPRTWEEEEEEDFRLSGGVVAGGEAHHLSGEDVVEGVAVG